MVHGFDEKRLYSEIATKREKEGLLKFQRTGFVCGGKQNRAGISAFDDIPKIRIGCW